MASRRNQIRMSEAEVTAFLEAERTAQVATVGANGRPHVMPLWYMVEPGNVVCSWTYARSQKVRNLERDPHATLGIETGETYDQLRGVMIEADVAIERDPAALTELGGALLKRYGDGGGLSKQTRELVAEQANKRVGMRFVPTKIVSWDHRKLGGSY